jgi:hypothetical protein
MSARDVRARFDQAGDWQFVQGEEGRWDFVGRAGSVKSASFEFHSGMLVAATLQVSGTDPLSQGKPYQSSGSLVATRHTTPEGAVVRVLSRDCPIHRSEVEQLDRAR